MTTAGRKTDRGALLRLGLLDADHAREHLARLGEAAEPLLATISATADPDAALAHLADLSDRVDDRVELLGALAAGDATGARLLAVLGASEALSEHLLQHPDHWRDLADPALECTRPPAYAMRAAMLESVGADPDDRDPVATLPDAVAVDALRVGYRRQLLRLAARDLLHELRVDDAAAELADLAAGTLEAALAVARQRVGDAARQVRLAVVAMGKCGGHELNYMSDVDVIFAHEQVGDVGDDAALRVATQLAGHLMRVCSDQTAEGSIWQVDAGLRPEGRHGPLSRTVASHQAYYERWAKGWEFQALLKARPVAGDLQLGSEFVAMTHPMVWTAAEREGFVSDAQAMRRRVIDHISPAEAERQLKLGVGGLRDVEFAVQLLQLVHGRTDERVRAPATLSALTDLTRAGYVGRDDGQSLHIAYAFLRRLEHRIQLHRLRRTHVVPADEPSLRRLGRSLGFVKDPANQLEAEWQRLRREVRKLHEKLFYRPLLEAVARIPQDEVRLSPEAAGDRLAALGYGDPKAALRNLEALTTGVSRTATLQKALLPAMLQWFAEGADPDAGLFGFRRISESLGRSPWYLKSLRDEGAVAERLARLLSTSRYVTDLLEREPTGVQMLGQRLTPLSAEALSDEMLTTAGRHADAENAVRAVRGARRRELLRIAAGEVLGLTDIEAVGKGLSRLTDATLEATLRTACRAVLTQHGIDAPPTRIAVVAMGRYGGFELSYGSDADVMFVHRPVDGADQHEAATFARAVAEELRRLLRLPATDPPLEVDADLRPEGKQGPLVRTLDSYAAYYDRWSATWEAQALLRADAVVGDLDLRRDFHALIDPLRYPEGGLSDDDIREIRRLKARVDTERLPKGGDPQMHLKFGRGGLTDIEWTVQLLQLRHAASEPALRTTGTLEALAAACEAGLLGDDDCRTLEAGWRLVSRTRNAIALARGKAADHLPRAPRERAAVAAILGYPQGATDRMVNDYLRATRRARSVVDRVFWDDAT